MSVEYVVLILAIFKIVASFLYLPADKFQASKSTASVRRYHYFLGEGRVGLFLRYFSTGYPVSYANLEVVPILNLTYGNFRHLNDRIHIERDQV